MPEKMSVLDVYNNRVYKIIVLLIPGFCLCASATITTLHFLGYYPDIDEWSMLIFVCTDIFYMLTGIFFIKTGYDENGVVKKKKLLQAKYTIAVMCIIQWNTISYLWPFTDFWAFVTLFTIVFAFFFDTKLVIFETIGILVSMFVSWVIKGGMLMPPDDDYYVANMTFRLVGIVLMLFAINVIAFFGGKFLVKEIENRIYYDKVTEHDVEKLTEQMKKFSPSEKATYESANVVELKINSRDEIKDIYKGIRNMQMNTVDHLNNLSRLREEKEKKEAELSVATRIQADMLPKDFPDRDGVSLYAAMIPAKEVGGDFYDFFFTDEDHLALVMADVSGKGVPAALFSVVTKAVLRDKVAEGGTPDKILEDTNRILCSNNGGGLFVTLWLGILDLRTGIVEYVNAGHEYPIISRNGSDTYVHETENYPPLAAMDDLEFESGRITLEKGSKLLLYTDGVPEAKSPDGKRFGMERLTDLLDIVKDKTPKEIISSLKHDIDTFQTEPFDDVTIMSLVWDGK